MVVATVVVVVVATVVVGWVVVEVDAVVDGVEAAVSSPAQPVASNISATTTRMTCLRRTMLPPSPSLHGHRTTRNWN